MLAVSSAIAADGGGLPPLQGRGRADDDDEANDEQSLKPLSLRASHDRRPPRFIAAAVAATVDDSLTAADSSSLRLAIFNWWFVKPVPPPPPGPPAPPRLLAADSVAILPRARMALPVFCSGRMREYHTTNTTHTYTREHANHHVLWKIENKTKSQNYR